MTSIAPSNQQITDLSSESATLSTSTQTSMSSNEHDSSAVLAYPHKKHRTQDLIEIYQPIDRCNDKHKVELDEDADGNIFATFIIKMNIRLYAADSMVIISDSYEIYRLTLLMSKTAFRLTLI